MPRVARRYHSSYITGATWSPTRPGVFFTSKKDGSLDVWDYFYKQNDPTLTVKVRLRISTRRKVLGPDVKGEFRTYFAAINCQSLAFI